MALGEETLKGSATDLRAKSGEKETREDRLAAAHHLLGLGLLGRGETAEAHEALARAAELNRNRLWATHRLSHEPDVRD